MPRYRIESRRYLPEYRGMTPEQLDGPAPVVNFGNRDVVETDNVEAAKAHFAEHLLPLYSGNLTIEQFIVNEVPRRPEPTDRVWVAKLRDDR
jgi:hypothetical protein